MARKKVCFNYITNADLDMMSNCCGIGELGNFKDSKEVMQEKEFDYGSYRMTFRTSQPATLNEAHQRLSAYPVVLATTIPSQRGAATALKAVGFEKISTSPSKENSRRTISLWMWKVGKKNA